MGIRCPPFREPPSEGTERTNYVVIRGLNAAVDSILPGANAVQAIHYGLRSWCTDQLGFLDSIFRLGAGYTIYPKPITKRLSKSELSSRMLKALHFEGEWTTIRVGDFALSVGIEQQVPVDQIKSILSNWLDRHPGLVAEMPTNERLITAGLTKHQKDAALRGFLRRDRGPFISHLRIHREPLE